MRLSSVRRPWLAARPTRWPTRRSPRERRRLPMQRASRLVQIVLEPIDFLAQLIAIVAIPIPIPVRAFVLAPQALDLTTLTLDLALLPLEFVNQLFACGRPPSREHASVMARLRNLYKYDFLDPAYG